MMKKVTLISLFLALVAIVVPFGVYAKMQTGDYVSLPLGETYEGDYYAAGEIVEISGVVDGDLYVAGGKVYIDGVVTGDLLAAGGEVFVTGAIEQDARVAGGQVDIEGSVGRNLTALGGQIELSNSGVVGRNAQFLGGTAKISGTIAGELVTAGGDVTLSGDVQDVEAAVGMLTIASGANVANINYYSEEEANLSADASISGALTRKEVPHKMDYQASEADLQAAARAFSFFGLVTSMLGTIILGAIMIKFFPRYMDRATELTQTSFLKSLGIGFIGLMLFPFLFIILLVTIVGMPFAFFSLAFFFMYLFLARIYVMIAFGKWAMDRLNAKQKSVTWFFAVGLVVYYLLSAIPVVGWLTKFVFLVAGFGAALRNEKITYTLGKKAKVF